MKHNVRMLLVFLTILSLVISGASVAGFIDLVKESEPVVQQSDTTAPTITFLNPSADETVGDIVTISFNATDESAIVDYQILIDNTIVAENATIYQWDTYNVTSGQHTIEAKATDAFGNIGTASITVTVDPNYESGVWKLLNYNIWETGRNPLWKEAVKEENPDILVAVETGGWTSENDPKLVEILNEFNTYFSNETPYQVRVTKPVSVTDGQAIFSRFPIVEFNQISTLTLDDGTKIKPAHDFLDAVVEIGSMYVHVVVTHYRCCSDSSGAPQRQRLADTIGILNYFDELGDVPIIYAGDFNSFSPVDTSNPELAPNDLALGDEPISILLNSSDPRASKKHQFIDVYRELNPYNPGYTYIDPFYQSRIDYIFVNQYFFDALINSTTGETPSGKVGSDHLPVNAWFNMDWRSFDLRPPVSPHGLNGTVLNSTSFQLTWDENTESDLAYYLVYRNDTVVANQTQTIFNDTGLTPDLIYRYEISAVDTSGNQGIKSNPLMVNTSRGILTKPGAPILSITPDKGRLILNWTIPDTGGLPIEKVYILRGGRETGPFKLYATVTGNSFVDSSVYPQITYYYKIIAVNFLGKSPESNLVSAAPLEPASEPGENTTPEEGGSSFVSLSPVYFIIPFAMIPILARKYRKT